LQNGGKVIIDVSEGELDFEIVVKEAELVH